VSTIEAAAERLGIARESRRVAELRALGIDGPLKLDLVVAVGQATAAQPPETLAAACGVSQREVVPPLDELVEAGLLERRRFYNLAEYARSSDPLARASIAALVAEGPVAIRKLRRALLPGA
jgi:hypothetical protein